MILNETSETVQIITFASANQKTGDMSQVWILNKDINPVKALKMVLVKRYVLIVHT